MAPKRKSFSKSSIVAQKIPRERQGVFKRGHSLTGITKSGKPYTAESEKIRQKLRSRTTDKRKRSTVAAFIRNYFVKHGEVPTIKQLETVFPYLKKEKK